MTEAAPREEGTSRIGPRPALGEPRQPRRRSTQSFIGPPPRLPVHEQVPADTNSRVAPPTRPPRSSAHRNERGRGRRRPTAAGAAPAPAPRSSPPSRPPAYRDPRARPPTYGGSRTPPRKKARHDSKWPPLLSSVRSARSREEPGARHHAITTRAMAEDSREGSEGRTDPPESLERSDELTKVVLGASLPPLVDGYVRGWVQLRLDNLVTQGGLPPGRVAGSSCRSTPLCPKTGAGTRPAR